MKYTIALFLALCTTGLFAQEMLTADDAVRIAVEQNHGIRLARLDARSAELLNNAGQAGMLPTVDAVGSYSVDNSSTKQTFFSGEVREADNADSRVLDGAVQLNWTVFDGLAMFAAKDRLEALELIGQTRLRQEIEATVYDVLAAYYQVVQLRKGIAVQREGVRISDERLEIARAGQRIGSASGLAVVQAQLDQSADSAAVLDLLVQESAAVARVNALMGNAPATELALGTDIPSTQPMEFGEIQQAARNANSVLQLARQERIAADFSVKQLRGALLPQVDVFGNYGYTKSTSAVGFLQSNRSIGPDYGARIYIPLFNGAQANKAMQVAKLTREQAAISTEQAELMLEESLLNAWTDHTTANQRVALEQSNLSGARTQTDVALESYRLGAITAVELREVQQGLITAEQRLLAAQYEAKLAELQLKWLAGELP
ncbi:MAG: TolC family protein [Flavobacteriales bacterium]|nr:TolC family protein [Flavobacteriales bacterium]MBK6943911.1 TolC family protein [Flavobacteriales bacterium]MBK7297799.1 TolC family protein [Flavobacteriales bacterium]MBK9533582.1 TolC family protein [Flavobacteriales bacterium]MBP9136872.1 TolC family protein [Flavobacteriales bacterium]